MCILYIVKHCAVACNAIKQFMGNKLSTRQIHNLSTFMQLFIPMWNINDRKVDEWHKLRWYITNISKRYTRTTYTKYSTAKTMIIAVILPCAIPLNNHTVEMWATVQSITCSGYIMHGIRYLIVIFFFCFADPPKPNYWNFQ